MHTFHYAGSSETLVNSELDLGYSYDHAVLAGDTASIGDIADAILTAVSFERLDFQDQHIYIASGLWFICYTPLCEEKRLEMHE